MVLGLNRWLYRVITYVALMRDEDPPFRLVRASTRPATPSPKAPTLGRTSSLRRPEVPGRACGHHQLRENTNDINHERLTALHQTPRQDRTSGRAPLRDHVSLPRLYFFRLGYLVMAVGLALAKWPLIINHERPWPLFEGVETCMLVALSLLWFLGLRYPLQMLPAAVRNSLEVHLVVAVVLPLWVSDQLDPATLKVFYPCLVVVIPLAVIPWRYVVAHYVMKQGDPWRSDRQSRSQ